MCEEELISKHILIYMKKILNLCYCQIINSWTYKSNSEIHNILGGRRT